MSAISPEISGGHGFESHSGHLLPMYNLNYALWGKDLAQVFNPASCTVFSAPQIRIQKDREHSYRTSFPTPYQVFVTR